MSSTFDADLAKANLYRMRADYKRAEEICLGILKTYPNSAATHTLLGDICTDQGRLEQAAQWYELSLDLDPGSLPDKQKLEDVRDQIRERDHISAVVQLGLPAARTSAPTWTLVGGAIVLIMAAGLGYAIRFGRLGSTPQNEVIRTPIKAVAANIIPALSEVDRGIKAPVMPGNGNPAGEAGAVPVTWPKDDQELKMEVVAKSKYGPRLLSLTQDLKTKITTVVYEFVESEDERVVGSDLAKAVFESSEDPATIILRSKAKDKLMYQAEVPRERYDETLTPEWQQKSAAPDAWISYILTNELWAKSPTDPTMTPNPDSPTEANPASSTGSAPKSSGDKTDGG